MRRTADEFSFRHTHIWFSLVVLREGGQFCNKIWQEMARDTLPFIYNKYKYNTVRQCSMRIGTTLQVNVLNATKLLKEGLFSSETIAVFRYELKEVLSNPGQDVQQETPLK